MLGIGLLFAACGESGTEGPTENIAELAQGNAELSTLVAALEAANLTDALAGDGPFTVFAPNNAAFEALPEGTVEALLANPDQLSPILRFHVVQGRFSAEDLAEQSRLTTLEGNELRIVSTGGGDPVHGGGGEATLRVGSAEVIQSDIAATNGIVHVIDAVLLPPEAPDEAEAPAFSEWLAGQASLSTLKTALEATGLDATLAEGSWTLFAPTDRAFDALPEGTLDALLADPDALADILLYHAVSGSVDAATVVGLSHATTARGIRVYVGTENDGVQINDANVTSADQASATVLVHIIDAVLLPPRIPEVLAREGTFSTLLAAVGAADLADTLNADGPLTVLAPTDAAFEALPEGTVAGLLEDIPALTGVLAYHVVEGNYPSTTVVTLTSATTLQGADVSIAVDGDAVRIGGALVEQVDIQAENGVIHVLSSVLLPPTD